MFIVARKEENSIKKVKASDFALDAALPYNGHNITLKVLEVSDYYHQETAGYHRIYYVFDGILEMVIEEKELVLKKGDACYLEKGMRYVMKGTFSALSVQKVARLS